MNQKNLSLSAIIIARDEASQIGACIENLDFCDVVLVVDNGSTDATAKIAAGHNARVIRVDGDDFAALRTTAKAAVKSEWILYVDADERVSPELAHQIHDVVTSRAPMRADSYLLHRVNYYLGHRWPTNEWMLRLFRQGSLLRWEGAVHETPIIKGTVGKLDGALVHDTHRTLSEMVEKTNKWSEIEARLRLAADHPTISWWRLLRVMMTGFMDSYIRQGGWRAGTAGLIESTYQGFSMFITYGKLWELQQGKSNNTPLHETR